MPITPDTPSVEPNVPTPKETSPVQTTYSSAVGMDLAEEIKLVGESVTPLKIVDFLVVDDSPSEDETTVNPQPEKTPTVASEKGTSSAAKRRGKRAKLIPARPLGLSGVKKSRTFPVSDKEDEEAPDSPDSAVPFPRAFLMQELERCEEQIRQFSSLLQQAQEAKSKFVILLSSGDGASRGGTAGKAQVHGEEAQAGGDGDQVVGTK